MGDFAEIRHFLYGFTGFVGIDLSDSIMPITQAFTWAANYGIYRLGKRQKNKKQVYKATAFSSIRKVVPWLSSDDLQRCGHRDRAQQFVWPSANKPQPRFFVVKPGLKTLGKMDGECSCLYRIYPKTLGPLPRSILPKWCLNSPMASTAFFKRFSSTHSNSGGWTLTIILSDNAKNLEFDFRRKAWLQVVDDVWTTAWIFSGRSIGVEPMLLKRSSHHAQFGAHLYRVHRQCLCFYFGIIAQYFNPCHERW